MGQQPLVILPQEKTEQTAEKGQAERFGDAADGRIGAEDAADQSHQQRWPGPDAGQETEDEAPAAEADDFDEDYARRREDLTLRCMSPEDFDPLSELSTDITPRGQLPKECPLSDQIVDLEQPRPWWPITFTWKASGLCHKPLYFEQVHLERYGHSWGPYVQPFVSGAHFFLSVPVLPYKMGLKPPNECVYTLGYYRPGNCAPYMLDPIPLSVRAGLAQAGAWTGGVLLVP